MLKRKFQMFVIIILILALFVPTPPKETANASSLSITNNNELAAINLPAMKSATVSAAMISAGGQHTCALTTSGAVKCWGKNDYGQLGDGTYLTTNYTPVDVVGLTSGVSAISAGYSHTCALTTAGGVKCWGNNNYAQLGDGTFTHEFTPVDVVGLTSGVSTIAAGYYHTCAVTTTGGVKCWGRNNYGQLGDGTTTDHSTPVDVVGLANGVSAVTMGEYHTCALTTSGGVKCWGYNGGGELGDGTTFNRSTPMEVVGLTNGIRTISAGEYHTCALTTSGGVMCWGSNYSGELGDGTTTNRSTPVDVVGLANEANAISAGAWYTCVLTTGGGVKCWGDNDFGQLGYGTVSDHSTLVDVTGLASEVSAIAVGWGHTCALTTSGGIKCWGYNKYGQLGDGTTTFRLLPVDVAGLVNGGSAIATGWTHTCALTTSGGVKCWGDNSGGQLGDGTTITRPIPVDVTGLTSDVIAVAAGYGHTCALTMSGGVKCWGRNDFGQLGDGTTASHSTPMDVVGLTSGVNAIAVGNLHTCALTTGGEVKCWGYNIDGQLGEGTTSNHSTPEDVVGLASGVSAIAAGSNHTCALTTNDGVKCWGDNFYRQLGDGTTSDQSTPMDVVGLTSGISAISAGYSHTCAITIDGGSKCWGSNFSGELGDGTTTSRSTPVDVTGLTSGVSSISAGYMHTCAITTAGGVKCWGSNDFGQLGDGTTGSRLTPEDVVGLASGVNVVDLGEYHTCVLAAGGGIKCWGNNDHGQLGWRILWVPVDVVGFLGGAFSNPLYLPIVIKN